MSKVDDYLQYKAQSDEMRKFADEVKKPRDGAYYADKFGMNFTINETWLGYYGSSSVYSWGDRIVTAMKAEIEKHLRELAEHAAKRLESVTEKSRLEAQDEARQILADTEPKA